jgi:serine/threonine protein kinase
MSAKSSSTVSRLTSLLGDHFSNIKPIGARTVCSTVMSAIRIEDSVPVVLKYVEGPTGEREATILRENQHPNIIRLLDHIQLDDGSCLVLPLAPLGDLGAFMKSKRFAILDDPSCNGWRSIIRQMLLPIQFLHSKGMNHNDIKLENYVVFGTKAEPIIVLIDLGLCCGKVDARIVGTFEYAAPEKFAKQPITQKADIWSIGVSVYAAFSGIRPFAVRNNNPNHRHAMIAKKVQRANIVFDRKFWMDYPEIEEFLRAILVPDPDARPSASDLLSHPILSPEIAA